MLPVCRPANASGDTKVFALSSVTGLQEWVDYIPVQAVTQVAGQENRVSSTGFRQVDSLGSAAGLTSFVDYIPVFVVTGRSSPWQVSADGYIPMYAATGLLGAEPPPQPSYANVGSLATFDGVDGATTYTDEKSSLVFTFSGGAELDTATAKFGTAALLVDGVSGSGVQCNDSAAHEIGTSAFCIEGCVRLAALPTAGQYINLASKYDASIGQRSWFFGIVNTAGTYQFRMYRTANINGTGNVQVYKDLNSTPIVGTYFHMAVTRDGSDNLRFFQDGTQAGTTEASVSTNFANASSGLAIGGLVDNGAMTGFNVNGSIDAFRLTVGEAIYTEDFTPPFEAHPTS